MKNALLLTFFLVAGYSVLYSQECGYNLTPQSKDTLRLYPPPSTVSFWDEACLTL